MARTRLFLFLLLGLALAGLVPLLVLGSSESIAYDGYWYLFIDTQNRWKLFLSEYRANAHPIIYQLLLRFVARFGHSRLLLRSASILPGAAGVAVMGLVARKVCRSRVVALLAAAAYGFSMVMIQINIDVRSYPLCLLFLLIAFLFLADVLQHPSGSRAKRSLWAYGTFVSLAIGTEYYAVFFLLASLVYLGLLTAVQERFRRDLVALFAYAPSASVIALLLPFATAAFFFLTHLRYQQPGDYGHLAQFYWVHGSPRLPFVLRNLRADLNYILPVEVRSTGVASILTAALLLYSFYFALLRKVPARTLVSGLPSLMALLLLAELMACSLFRRYPFGGFERQQSIVFPFLILGTFVLLDQLIASLSQRWLQICVLSLVALLIGINFRYRWHKTPRNSIELFAEQYRTFLSSVPAVPATYVDQFSLIGYYIYTHNLRWRFERHLREPDRVDEYRLGDVSGHDRLLLRDMDQWAFDLHNPHFYTVLARALHDARISRINLFMLKQVVGHAAPSEIRTEEAEIAKLAAEASLEVGAIYDDNAQTAVTFIVH